MYNVLKIKIKSLDKKIETILIYKGGPKIQARNNFDRKHWILIKNKFVRSGVDIHLTLPYTLRDPLSWI